MEIAEEKIKDILETQRQEFQRYFGVLADHFESQVKTITETFVDFQKQLSIVREQLLTVREMVAKNTEDIEVIKLDIGFIKNELKMKVDRDEFAVLEKRVSFL